jgi:tetratricopeptide (TPR) repeat protein
MDKLGMNRLIFAAAFCAAAALASAANAERMQLSEAQCVNPNLAPADRVHACQTYLNDGLIGTDKRNSQYALGHAYRLAGDYANAEKTMSDVAAANPKWVNALLERSTIYAQDGKYDLALADVAQIPALNDDPALASMQRCWVRGVAGKALDAAAGDCNDALKAYPKSFAVLLARALVDYKRGDMAAAIADSTAALEDQPKSAGALYLRGVAKGPDGAGDLDAAKGLSPYIAGEFAGYGVK